MLGQKNKTHIVVGKDLALLAEGSTRASLVAGTIGIFANGSATAIDGTTDLAAGDKFKVVYMNVDGNIIESPMYDYDLLKRKKAKNYAASTEQKTAIGYNGTSGSIVVANSENYIMHLVRKDWSKTWGEHGHYKLLAAYESDASATQTEIAFGLMANAVKNLALEKQKSGVEVTKLGLLNSATVTLTNDFAGNCVVVKGVAALTVASSGQYATNTDVAVGDYVRLGATTATAVTTSANIYRVTAISGTTTKIYTLDRPVTEPSGTYATGTGTEVVPKATAEAANWGIVIESLPVKFEPGKFKFQNITFEVTLGGFGSTAVTELTAAYKGVGTYKEVAEIEWELSGNRGEGYKVASFPVQKNLNATSGKTYDMISLDFENDNARTLDGKATSFHSLVIATEDESSSTVHTQLKDVLNIA